MPPDPLTVTLGKYVARKVLDAALTRANSAIKSYLSSITSTADDLESAIYKHLIDVKNWSSEAGFADSANAKLTQRVYVDLDCFVMPRSLRVNSSEQTKRIRLEDLFREGNNHLVFLGTPGAGKTTSMKNICNRVFTEEHFAGDFIHYPIVVKLRDLNGSTNKTPLVSELVSILGLSVGLHESIKNRTSESQRVKGRLWMDALCAVLNESRALVVLDGFDEVADVNLRSLILDEVRSLTLKLETSTLIMTSRTGEFVRNIDNAKVYEICPLTNIQIEKFAKKWLGKPSEAKNFVEQVKKSPFGDAAIKPLNLAHLCALFERIGSIPEKPKTVYRKILRLLLEEWDEQRSVRRTSGYAKFEADRKYDFLAALSYHLTTEREKLSFGSHTLVKIYKRICRDFSLPADEAKQVAQEIESHTGLLLKCGHDEYEFAHKSLQEFLAAEFIVRLPSVPKDVHTIKLLPNELGIAVTISSSSSLYFTSLVFDSVQSHRGSLPPTFYSAFITRLVQEKPDFDGQDAVVLALLCLYSITLDAFSDGGSQLSLFLIDPMLKDYERLVGLLMSSNTADALNVYYRPDIQAVVLSDHSVIRFRKIKELKGFSLPEVLYVREPFLNEMGLRYRPFRKV
jgi:hypothetical protein